MKSRKSPAALLAMWLTAWSSFASAGSLAGTSPEAQMRASEVMHVADSVKASDRLEAADIEAAISRYFIALNRGDIGAIMNNYTNDRVLLPFLQPTIVGTEAVLQNYEDTFRQVRFQMHTTIQELVRMSPEWAYVRTDSAGLFTPTKTAKSVAATFHELFLLRKSDDGTWRIARYSFSPTAQLPPF